MMFLALGVMYVSPFLAWWSAAPLVPYFAANVAAYVLGMVGVMVLLMGLSVEAGRWLGDASLRQEARAGSGMAVWLVACTAGALAWMYHRAGVFDAGLLTLMAQVARLSKEARMLFLLPYAMTAYVMWRSRDAALRRLAGMARGEGAGAQARG